MPGERSLRIAIVIVALVGIAATGYLSVVEVAGEAPVCLSGGTGCRTVAASPYAELVGVRVSYLGLLGFVGLIGSALIPGPLGRFGGACMAVTGGGFSIYLTAVELTVIDAVCEYCLVTAASMVVLLALTLTRVAVCEREADAAPPGPGGEQVHDAGGRRFMRRAGVAAAVSVAVLVALIAVSRSGLPEGGWPPEPSPLSQDSDGTTTARGTREVRAELSGLRQDGAVIGRAGAPVTVTEYGDLQCPLCGGFAATGVPKLLSGPVADGEVKLEYENWAIFGPQSTKAAKAALAAGEQDRMWDFVSLFYRNQGTENTGYVTDGFLSAIAEGAGVDMRRWNRDRGKARWGPLLDEIDAQARAHGFKGTPGLVVEGPAGAREIVGVPTPAELDSAIAAANGS